MRQVTKLVIYGQTPSKKSSQTMVVNKKGRPILLANKKYRQWEKGAVSQLTAQKEIINLETFDCLVHVRCMVYRRTKRKIDKLNLEQSIHDVLEKAKVIENDFLIEDTDGSRRILGVPEGQERAEIFITKFSA